MESLLRGNLPPMNLGDWLIGVPIALVILYYLIVGVILVVTELIPFVYRTFRYEHRGYCPECHAKYVSREAQLADQTYGSAAVYQNICPNGHVGMTHGNRRFADWAGF